MTFWRWVIKNKDFVLKDKKSVYIDSKAKIGKNVIIYENNRIEGESVIEDNVTIFPNCFLINTIIGKGTKIYSSTLINSKIGKCSSVGPYCHLKRANVGDHVKVGAFSEIKNTGIASASVVDAGSIISKN